MRSFLAPFILLTVALSTSAQTLLVLNKEGSLAFVDPNTRQVSVHIRTGNGPHEVDTDGKLACVSNYGGGQAPGNTLSIIDVAVKKELHRAELGALRMPHGIFVADGKCWFTAESNKVIARYDPATRQIDTVLGTGQNGTHMVMVSKDGSQIYTSNIGSNSISIFDRAGVANWNQTIISVGLGPEGFDVTPDGRHLWTAHSRDGGVSVIDLPTKKVVAHFKVQTKRSNRLKISPDGRLVLISDLETGELLVLERETRKELKRLKVGRGLSGILIAPDSTRAYVAATGDNNVAIIDLRTLDLVDRINPGQGPDGMAWVQ